MRDYIQQGIDEGVITLNDNNSIIEYSCSNKKYYYNSAEVVRTKTFLQLYYDYNYPINRIQISVPVSIGNEVREADIVVYNDDGRLSPFIIVECLRQEVSEAEFQQTIEKAYSFAYALPCDIKYILVTSGIKSEHYEVDKNQRTRELLPDIPQFGVAQVANYRYVYRPDLLPRQNGSQRFFDISPIDQSELTRRFKQAHEALWAGGQLNPSEAFDELDKLIFCKVWDERKPRRPGDAYDFQIMTISKSEEKDEAKRRLKENESLYKRVISLYEEGRNKDPEVFKDGIRLSPERIRTVVGYLESVNLGETDLDSKGRAFETFISSFFRGSFGQYFTPREVVDFIVSVLPITKDSKVLDTSCGSGGFLLYALDKIRHEAATYYGNYLNDTKEYNRWYSYWHGFASNCLFGIEISEQISRAAKMNMIIHDDGHTNIITSDGLLTDREQAALTGNEGFKYESFDFIITNPPFGSIIRQGEHDYLKDYQLGRREHDWLSKQVGSSVVRESQSSEVLFIEQGYRYLKENGILAIVLPDGLLTSRSMQYVRDKVGEWFKIVAIVSLPQTAFSANGAGVKSSVLFLKKWTEYQRNRIANEKAEIEYSILREYNYYEECLRREREIKQKQNNKINDIRQTSKLSVSEAKKSEAYCTWNKHLMEDYEKDLDAFKRMMISEYKRRKKDRIQDYAIYMAIAEEIGYDSTGRKVERNDLIKIAEELKSFINS